MTGARFEQTALEYQPNPLSAMKMIQEVPVIKVESRKAVCDGGKSSSLGHVINGGFGQRGSKGEARRKGGKRAQGGGALRFREIRQSLGRISRSGATEEVMMQLCSEE
jgi:hypothetical protein